MGKKKILKATHDGELVLGSEKIGCYVLEDTTRVLYQRSTIKALGMARGSSGGSSGDRLAKFIQGKAIKSFVSKDLAKVTTKPIKFRTPKGHIGYGYPATVLTDICEAVIKAKDNGALQKQQLWLMMTLKENL